MPRHTWARQRLAHFSRVSDLLTPALVEPLRGNFLSLVGRCVRGADVSDDQKKVVLTSGIKVKSGAGNVENPICR